MSHSKTKEEIQKFINELLEIIKGNEKIGKYTQYYEKNNEKLKPVMIKTLSYICEIEKNNQKVLYFLNELKKNMNIKFNKNENTLEYSNYYFNGISTPVNIQSNEQSNSCMNISWKINELSQKLRDTTQYRYNLEIKDNNKNIYNYEGKETNIEIRGLINNNEYEFRVRTLYKKAYGNWSEYQKIKFKRFSNQNPFCLGKNSNIEVFGVELNDNNNNNIFQNKCSSSLYNNSIPQKNFISWKKIN